LAPALQSNHFAMPLSIVRVESANNLASFLVSTVSFGVAHLGRCHLSNFIVFSMDFLSMQNNYSYLGGSST